MARSSSTASRSARNAPIRPCRGHGLRTPVTTLCPRSVWPQHCRHGGGPLGPHPLTPRSAVSLFYACIGASRQDLARVRAHDVHRVGPKTGPRGQPLRTETFPTATRRGTSRGWGLADAPTADQQFAAAFLRRAGWVVAAIVHEQIHGHVNTSGPRLGAVRGEQGGAHRANLGVDLCGAAGQQVPFPLAHLTVSRPSGRLPQGGRPCVSAGLA